MKTTIRALAVFFLLPPSRTRPTPFQKPVDTSFLKQYAETRGFMLGRPQKPKIAPDGKTVLFLRADPKAPKMKLFEFDVASGKTKELLSPEMLLKGGGREPLARGEGPPRTAARQRRRLHRLPLRQGRQEHPGEAVGQALRLRPRGREGDRAEDRRGRRDRRSEVVAGRHEDRLRSRLRRVRLRPGDRARSGRSRPAAPR